MQTQIVPTTLQSLMASSPVAEAVSADLKRGTVTFKLADGQRIQGGGHVLLPQIIAQLALTQEAAQTYGQIVLTKPSGVRAYFGANGDATAMTLRDSSGISIGHYFQDAVPPKRYPQGFKPGQWWGSEKRIDQNGCEWNGPHRRFVHDDFGSLVEAPA